MSVAVPRLVSLNGSPRQRSRTDALVRAIAASIRDAVDAEWRHLRIADIGPVLLVSLTRDDVSPTGEAILQDIEAADIVIVGTPVYRASLTGALKHVFDLVHYEALRGRIAVLAATGANRHHGLVTEHQLRPLMSFFGTVTAPTAIYAEEADFDGEAIRGAVIGERIAAVTRDVVRLLSAAPR
jgi:FMN reductase